MKSLKLQFLLGITSCGLVLTSVNALANSSTSAATPMPVVQEPQAPPAQAPSDQASPTQASPNQDSSKQTTFTGTVMKNGENYVLRDSSGGVYKLDDSSRAQAFEGKTVTVTGRLDADSKTIHVDTIKALAS